MRNLIRLSVIVAVWTAFSFPCAAHSGAPDESLSELIKVEEEALQYLQKTRDFYNMLMADSVVLFCIPNDPDDSADLLLPAGTRVFWTQQFGLAVWKSEGEFRRAMAFIHRHSPVPEKQKQPLEKAIQDGLEFSRTFKLDLKTTIDNLEQRIQSKKLEIEKLKKRQKEQPAAVEVAAESRYFRESDFDIIEPDIKPAVIKKKWISGQPTDSLMLTGTWRLGSEVNIVVAVEAFLSDIYAQMKFEDRVKALAAGYQNDRRVRSERGGPTGHFNHDSTLEVCDSWLPEEGSTWLGSRGRTRRFRSALITVSASYLDPVEEDRLVYLMRDLENRAMTVVKTAEERK
jgi:hypothetical protein